MPNGRAEGELSRRHGPSRRLRLVFRRSAAPDMEPGCTCDKKRSRQTTSKQIYYSLVYQGGVLQTVCPDGHLTCVVD